MSIPIPPCPGNPGDLTAELTVRLQPNHLADLRRSGLNDETIFAANLRSINDAEEAGKVLGWNGPAFTLGPCLFFHFHDPDGAPLKYGRLKPDRPRRGKDGKAIKYEAPKCKANRAYFPPHLPAVLNNPLADLFLCEGEKKGLSGTQRGFPTIALSGVYAWQVKRKKGVDGVASGPRQLIPDLEVVSWSGRRVFVVFDSDIADNPNVAWAAFHLAIALRTKGAIVRIIVLPAGPNGEKVGLDDYLVAHTDEEFRELVAAAREPAPPFSPRIDDVTTVTMGQALEKVHVVPQEYRTNDAAVAMLPRVEGLYQRGELLVRVVEHERDDTDKAAKVFRPEGVRIVILNADTLREDLTRVVAFVKKTVTDEGEGERVVHPPGHCVRAVVGRKFWPGVPHLTGIVNYPVILSDGRIHSARGYDAESGLYQEADLGELDIPVRPTRDDARRAVGVLADVFCDFPFASEGDRSAALTGVLTPLARYAYSGPTPMHLNEANTRGGGKSLIADTQATIVAGRDFARTAYKCDKVETDKQITALVAAGDPLVLFDNVAGKFGDAALDAALTATTWKGRLLGTSQMYSGPLDVCFYATANNAELTGDLSRRVVVCRLFTAEEFPEDRADFKYPLPGWAKSHRRELLTAALMILKAYMVAGQPDQQLKPFGSFDGWSGLVRSAVVWAGMADPLETRERTRAESDQDAAAMRTLLAEVAAHYPEGHSFTLRDVVAKVGGEKAVDVKAGWETVAELLVGMEATTAARLGYRFRKYKGRNFGGLKLIAPAGKATAGQRWCVVPAKQKTPEPEASSPSSRRHGQSDDYPSGYTPPNGYCHPSSLAPESNGTASRSGHYTGTNVTPGDDDDDGYNPESFSQGESVESDDSPFVVTNDDRPWGAA